MCPSISKCNAKRCSCWKHLCCKPTIKSNVNGRQFPVITNSDLDWKSTDVIYVLSWEEKDCGMQYVGQTCRFLKTWFSEHYRQTKKPRKIDNFLYRHFKQTNHSTSSISIQPVETITYNDNSTRRYRNILRHELEFNGKNYYKHHTHLVLMIIFTMRVTFLDYLILMFFFFKIYVNAIIDLMVNAQMEI